MITRRAFAIGLVVLVLSGCAERRLVTAPTTAPTTSTWAVVWAAGIAAALVIGVLLTLPAWRTGGGARLAVAVLTAQAGAVAVSATVLAGVAIRTWQLIDREPTEPATALLRLSRIDGDTQYFSLVLLLLALSAALVTTITALAARFAAGSDPLERWLACAVVILEIGGAAYALVRLVLGEGGWPYLGGALALPVLGLALISCWPRGSAAAS
jgi:hypothetical protein